MDDKDEAPPSGSEDMIRRARQRFGSQPDGDQSHTERSDLDRVAERAGPPEEEPRLVPVDPSRSRRTAPRSLGAPDRARAETTARPTESEPTRPRWAGPTTSPRRWLYALGWAGLVVFQVVRGSLFGAESLEAGECFNSPQLVEAGATAELDDLDVVSCDEPHLGEAFATVSYSSTSTDEFPGNAVLNRFASEQCAATLKEFIDGDPLDSGFDLTAITPNRRGWDAGNRTVECTLVRLDGQKAVGSAEGVGRVVPAGLVSLLRVSEGNCVDLSEWVAFGVPVACSKPHDLEVFAVLTSPAEPGAPYPSEEEVATYAFQSCAREFEDRVDPNARADLGFAPVAFPLPFTWQLGHRSYVCGLFAADASKLAGSRLLAHGRLGDLVRSAFDEEPLLIDLNGFAGVESIEFVGSAALEGDVLALTKFAEHASRGVPFEEERTQRGAAWLRDPVPIDRGFTTAFVFQFEMYSWFTVGDGLAFVVQGGDTDALGRGIGYDGMPDSLAVEFDTLKEDWLSDPRNNVPGAPDLLGNHVSVQTRGTARNDTHTDASLGWANLDGFHMADRAPHVALIVYEPGRLDVYVDDFDTPALTVGVDIADILELDDGMAHVGFTASSGPELSRGPRTSTIAGHKILAWEMAVRD